MSEIIFYLPVTLKSNKDAKPSINLGHRFWNGSLSHAKSGTVFKLVCYTGEEQAECEFEVNRAGSTAWCRNWPETWPLPVVGTPLTLKVSRQDPVELRWSDGSLRPFYIQ